MSQNNGAPDERAGILFAGSAYVMWGVLPVYWHALAAVSPFQLTACRVALAALFAFGVTLARGRLARIVAIVTTPQLFRNLAASAALIAVNWTVFVYSIATDRIVEASLGYYILPLLSIALGVLLFGERLSRMRLAALALAAVAVAAQAIAVGHLPWIALVLALSFGFYGIVKKLTHVDPLDGFLIEMGAILPAAIGVLLWSTAHGNGAFTASMPGRDALLLASGPITAIPLSLFAAGARRVRLSTLGFLQYLGPSLMLVIAVLAYGEPLGFVDALTFGCVWTALVIVAVEGQWRSWRLKALAGE